MSSAAREIGRRGTPEQRRDDLRQLAALLAESAREDAERWLQRARTCEQLARELELTFDEAALERARTVLLPGADRAEPCEEERGV